MTPQAPEDGCLLRRDDSARTTFLIAPDRRNLGAMAAAAVALALQERIAHRGGASVLFASAPSQEEFLEALGARPEVDWSRVTAFQLDEYVGLQPSAPQAIAQFLRDRLFNRVQPNTVCFLDGNAADLPEECARYADLLRAHPLDVACVDIGENGHIAFNDPDEADFADPFLVKLIALDQRSRAQQVHDGCFASLNAVPVRALTLTLPAILEASRIYCIVPGRNKAQAVHDALYGPVTTACPASILRTHPNATIYLDPTSAARL